MAKTIAFELVKVGDGVAAFQGGPDEAFLNPMGGPRPRGWALTPVDSVEHCAATTLLPVGTGDTTIETKVNFSHPQGILGGSTRSRGLYRKALAYFRPRVQSSTRKAACSRREPP